MCTIPVRLCPLHSIWKHLPLITDEQLLESSKTSCIQPLLRLVRWIGHFGVLFGNLPEHNLLAIGQRHVFYSSIGFSSKIKMKELQFQTSYVKWFLVPTKVAFQFIVGLKEICFCLLILWFPYWTIWLIKQHIYVWLKN